MTEMTIGEPARRDYIAALLTRYPDIPAADTKELLAFLRNGAILDIGMLKGNPEARARIERVQDDHAAYFKATMTQRLTVTALLVVPVLLMCWMAWYWGTK